MAARGSIDGISDLLQGVFSNPEGLRRVLEAVLAAGMREEVAAHVGAGRHARGGARTGYRNGTKPRALATRVGELALSVPQVRDCEAGAVPPVDVRPAAADRAGGPCWWPAPRCTSRA